MLPVFMTKEQGGVFKEQVRILREHSSSTDLKNDHVLLDNCVL